MEKQCGVGPEKGPTWREASREVTLMDQESYISVMDPGNGIGMDGSISNWHSFEWENYSAVITWFPRGKRNEAVKLLKQLLLALAKGLGSNDQMH